MNIHVKRLTRFLAAASGENCNFPAYNQMAAKLTKDQRKRLTTAGALAATQAESPNCVNAECGNLALFAGGKCFKCNY